MGPRRVDIFAKGFELVRNRFPITVWLPTYDLRRIGGDVISGLTCGILIIPHALALSSLAGLPPQYGLYSAFPPGLVYGVFGTAKDINVGPTALTSILTAQYNPSGSPVMASLLSFLIGCIILAIGIFRLGFVVEFISAPALSGFVSAVAVTIIVSQTKYVLGLGRAPQKFHERVWFIITHIKETNFWDIGMGVCCLILLIVLQLIVRAQMKPKGTERLTRPQQIANQLLWFCGIARSAIVAFFATFVSYLVHLKQADSFTTAGKLPPGLPSFQSPFADIIVDGNSTISTTTAIGQVGSGVAVLALIIYLQSVAVAKTLSTVNGYQINASQEAIALGMINIVGSMLQAYPVAGSFARSAVNSMTNAVSPLSGIITSLVVILALTVMMPVFEFVPLAALAVIIIASVVPMIDYGLPKKLWKVNRWELIPTFLAFIGSLYQFEIGILLGAGCSLFFLLHRALKPRMLTTIDSESGVVYVNFKGGVWFAGMDSVLTEIRSIVASNPLLTKVVLDCGTLFEADFSSAYGLKRMIVELRMKCIEVDVINLNEDHVRELLMKAGLKQCLETTNSDCGERDSGKAMPLLNYQTEV